MPSQSMFKDLFVASLGFLAVLAATPAHGATTTQSQSASLTGTQTLSSTGLTATGAGVTATTDLVANLGWNQSASLNVTFDPNLLRQGRALDPSVGYSRPAAGSMTLGWTLSNISVSWDGIGPLDLGSPTFNATGSCNLLADGSAYLCHLSSSMISIIDPFPAPGPYVRLGLAADVTITPQAIATARDASYDGNPAGTANLSLLESDITDTFSIPCTIPAGSDLTYALGSLSTTPGITVVTSLVFDVGLETPVPDPLNPPLFLSPVYVSFATPTIPIDTRNTSIAMGGDGASFDLGAVQANNIPPTANAGGPYSGNEGAAIQFNGGGSSSICGFPTLVWNFSDGSAAFGATPLHTFPGAGSYSGQLTAIDATGLTALTTFGVTLTNLPPVVSAGPDTTSAWGVPVTFNGAATDPGTADQPYLVYSWTFGDGTPSASGGPSTLHAYAAPGAYTATLKACDQYGACATGNRIVNVVKRATTLAWLGDTSGTYDTPATLSGSLVDQFGAPVSGRNVVFQVGTDGPFTAQTNSTGLAVQSYTPALGAGSVTGTATFAGDALYEAANASSGFTIARKATSIAYTGATSGKPNKVIALSATLKDATGKALAGRAVAFKLGTQTASATTDAFGVAATSLQLNQKNGTYTLTASFTPAGGDIPDYLGSSQSVVFALQTK